MYMNKTLLLIVIYPWSVYLVFSIYLRNVNSKSIATQQAAFKTIYNKDECGEIFDTHQCSYIEKSMQKYMERLKLKFGQLVIPSVIRMSFSHLKKIPMESPEGIGGMEKSPNSKYQLELRRM